MVKTNCLISYKDIKLKLIYDDNQEIEGYRLFAYRDGKEFEIPLPRPVYWEAEAIKLVENYIEYVYANNIYWNEFRPWWLNFWYNLKHFLGFYVEKKDICVSFELADDKQKGKKTDEKKNY